MAEFVAAEALRDARVLTGPFRVTEEGALVAFLDERDLAAIGMCGDFCRHGCDGDCLESGSERCDFTCHPELEVT